MAKQRVLPPMATIVATFNQAIVSGEHCVPHVLKKLEYAQAVIANSRKPSFRRKFLGFLNKELASLEGCNVDGLPVIQKAWCALIIEAFTPHKREEAPPIYEWDLVRRWAKKAHNKMYVVA